jgi:hypothetical protein
MKKRCSSCKKELPIHQLRIIRCTEKDCSFEAVSCLICDVGVVGQKGHASRRKYQQHLHRMHNALWNPDGSPKVR